MRHLCVRGETAEPEVIAAIAEAVYESRFKLRSRPLTMHFGPAEAEALKRRIRDQVPAVRRVYLSVSVADE